MQGITVTTAQLHAAMRASARTRVEVEAETGYHSTPAEIWKEAREVAGCYVTGKGEIRRAAVAYAAAFYAALDAQLNADVPAVCWDCGTEDAPDDDGLCADCAKNRAMRAAAFAAEFSGA